MSYDMATIGQCERRYLALNIWCMGDAREALLAVGALATEYAWDDLPAYPECLGEETHYDEEGEPLTEEAKAFEEGRNKYLRWRPDNSMGIPIHKLGSNDGWIVTPDECSEAVKAWADAPPEVTENAPVYVQEFVEWIALAADYGGFVVF